MFVAFAIERPHDGVPLAGEIDSAGANCSRSVAREEHRRQKNNEKPHPLEPHPNLRTLSFGSGPIAATAAEPSLRDQTSEIRVFIFDTDQMHTASTGPDQSPRLRGWGRGADL